MDRYRQLSEDVGDQFFCVALWNSLYYGVASVGLGLIVSFLLALLLNQKVPGIALFRTIFYLPSVVSGIAVAHPLDHILNADFGLLNTALRWFGIKGAGLAGISRSGPCRR